jgi:hypothetical protein
MPVDTPDPTLTIRFSPKKLLLIFAPLAVLVAISLLINPESWLRAEAWVYWVFGGLAAFLVFACIIMPSQYYLRLTPKGLTIHYVGWGRFYTWDEMRDFRVEVQDFNGPAWAGKIVFNLTEDSPHRSGLTRLTGAILKYDVSMMATYNRSASEIVDLLRQWQEQYGRTGTVPEQLSPSPELSRDPDHEPR